MKLKIRNASLQPVLSHFYPAKDENGDLLADSNIVLNRWKSYFFQLLNVHDVSDVR
jgi:hypothetical protein